MNEPVVIAPNENVYGYGSPWSVESVDRSRECFTVAVMPRNAVRVNRQAPLSNLMMSMVALDRKHRTSKISPLPTRRQL